MQGVGALAGRKTRFAGWRVYQTAQDGCGGSVGSDCVAEAAGDNRMVGAAVDPIRGTAIDGGVIRAGLNRIAGASGNYRIIGAVLDRVVKPASQCGILAVVRVLQASAYSRVYGTDLIKSSAANRCQRG